MGITSSLEDSDRKLLDGKVGVVYGAGGGVGSAVAKAFAREGARVYLAGRNESSLSPVAKETRDKGGIVDIARVDALDEKSVESHLHEILTKSGRVDISFNLISSSYAIGTKLTELSDQRSTDAAFNRVRSCFITMTAAGRIMEKQGSGVILGLTAPNARLPRPNSGGFAIGEQPSRLSADSWPWRWGHEESEWCVLGQVAHPIILLSGISSPTSRSSGEYPLKHSPRARPRLPL